MRLQRQIEGEESGAGHDEREHHDKKEDVIVDAIREEFAIARLEAELDHEDERVDERRKLGEEADDEEEGDEHLHIPVHLAIAARAVHISADFAVAEIGERDADDDPDQEGSELLVVEKIGKKGKHGYVLFRNATSIIQ